MSQQPARTVVVSGGGTGLGLAIARWFVEHGDAVVILGRRESVLREAAQRLRSAAVGAPVSTHAVDLEDPAAVEALARDLGQELAGATGPGSIDVLVNNAGGIALESEDTLAGAKELWLRDFTNNVVTTVLLTEALAPMLTRPGGRVVAMSSLAALSGAGSYGAAKAALHAWVYTMAARLGSDGITVNAVAPGFVPDTEFWDGRRRDEVARPRIARTLVGKAGTPDEIAEAVGYLTSRDSGFTTGQILQVNGGAGLGRG